MQFTNDLNKSQAAKILACYGVLPENNIQKSEEVADDVPIVDVKEEGIESTETVVDEGTKAEE